MSKSATGEVLPRAVRSRRMKERAPIVVSPLAVSQLNVEAVAGINPRRYLDWLASHPDVPRARIGKLAIVEASVLLEHLGELAGRVADTKREAVDDDEQPQTVDEVLARLGRRRLTPAECITRGLYEPPCAPNDSGKARR